MATSTAWQRRLRDCIELVHLVPAVALPGSSLAEIVAALAADPRPGVVFVTDASDRLRGWIPERDLEADLLVTVLPPEVWRVVGDRGVHDALRAALAPQP